jgi:hypothetical protein
VRVDPALLSGPVQPLEPMELRLPRSGVLVSSAIILSFIVVALAMGSPAFHRVAGTEKRSPFSAVNAASGTAVPLTDPALSRVWIVDESVLFTVDQSGAVWITGKEGTSKGL